jgi:hypothetical protein
LLGVQTKMAITAIRAKDPGSTHLMVLNDILVDAACFMARARFGVSPFCVGLAHKNATLEAQLSIDIALRQVTDQEK